MVKIYDWIFLYIPLIISPNSKVCMLCVCICVSINTNFSPIDGEKLDNANINNLSFIKERGWEKLLYPGLLLGTLDSIPKVCHKNSFPRTLWHEWELLWGQVVFTVEKCKYKACTQIRWSNS